MFVPRAVRLKGVREQRPKPPATPSLKPPAENTRASSEDVLVEAMRRTRTTTYSPAPQQEVKDSTASKRGPRFTVKPVTPEYIAQLAAGIELIFTDYAHQEEKRQQWLEERHRVVDGEQKFIHLTAILQHPNISKMKPEVTQVLLQQALQEHPSDILEVAQNGYFVRRKPSSYPLPFVPNNSFDVVDDDGLAFWDQRTIYVEPHLRNLCQTPAKVAYWLKEHGQLKPKWLPIQAVHMLWNSCAFVVLSGNVMHDDVWRKWREANKPDDWKVMTKVEHTKRTAEYLALLEKENPRGMRKANIDASTLPAIERPAALPMDVEIVPEEPQLDVAEQPGGKKKRKRRKPNKSSHQADEVETNNSNFATEGADIDEPSRKRRG
ncbi:hypothetical protein P153DRAFT_288057 [Dothidotthia symphoricarpi CBS 119687]|uniref:Uncharacterized protein n=1 Tax=Dothidotthia symphoricarpi CBS 119687 TaxID=1392245 RepID=A0A6A6AI04_9PLEO|nr:uncharacterized protein P153DRAFT_288057 [Dothidotthia symphoricarpi CBS 119687]KAF2131186.1 hypothetical protein P153DRAFT_288057 [Dothidotthia symphoricarpi CBS 119687]